MIWMTNIVVTVEMLTLRELRSFLESPAHVFGSCSVTNMIHMPLAPLEDVVSRIPTHR
jgi:hypothetical protein